MTKISAKVIADSKNGFGNRITTMVVTFPRFILAELNTHRMLSKNSASSRAIPFEKMLKSVEENPFIPIAWQKDHKSMQGTEYFTNEVTENEVPIVGILNTQWLVGRDSAVKRAKNLSEYGLTKQLCNRLLEPFMWHQVIVTATEWENFFALRCPQYGTQGGLINPTNIKTYRSRKDLIKRERLSKEKVDEITELDWLQSNKGQAEIHMMALAEAMWDAMNESVPKQLKAGEWHIPFGENIDESKLAPILGHIGREDGKSTELIKWNDLVLEAKIKIATARCARVSYTVVGEEDEAPNYENDIKLHDRLRLAGHMSPFEHCAQAMNMTFNQDISEDWSGNFRGFIQYRKTLPNENITK